MMRKSTYYLFLLLLLGGLSACQQDGGAEQAEQRGTPADTTQAFGLDAQLDRLSREIARSPDNWALRQDRSLLYFQKGEVDSAIADVRKGLSFYEDSPELHFLRGYYGLSQGDTGLAMYQFELAANYGSANPETFYQMGQIAFFQKNYDQALRHYEQAAALDSLAPLFVFAQGFLEESRNRPQQALRLYEQALQRDPNHVKTLLQLHDFWLEKMGDEKQAMAYNQRVLDQAQLHPLARYNEGNFHFRAALQEEAGSEAYQNQINEAVVAYTLSINQDKEKGFAEPYFYRGYCYFLAERLELALNDFRQTVEIDSTHAQAHFYLGSINEFYQDRETALFHYEQALTYQPNFPEARLAVADLRKRM
jgi:tetratricopeptide (TPR) repeat protein